MCPVHLIRWTDATIRSANGTDTPPPPLLPGLPLVIVDDVRGRRPGEGFDRALFTPAELERAARMRLDVNRAELLGARGIVRTVVARHVGLAASAVRFGGPRSEKPRLADLACANIDVSVAHADGRVACGFLLNGTIGVDIEVLDWRMPDTRAVARNVLSPVELDALDRSPRDELDALFLRAWTRKEAVLKAMGVGLSMPTTDFDVLRWTGSDVEDVSPVDVHGRRYVCQSVDSEPELLLAVACATESSSSHTG